MSSRVFEQRISTLMSLERFDEASRIAQEWIAASPDQAEPHAHLAWALLAKGDNKSAEDVALQACRLDAEWHWPLRLLAAAVFKRGDYARALQLMQACLRIAPLHADYHYVLARVHDSLGERELALSAARRAVELEPDNPEYLRSLHDREFLFQATELEIFEHYYKLRGILALDPNNTATLADLARLHRTFFADSQSAECLLRQALMIDPTNRELQGKLRDIIRDRDRWFEALFLLIAPLISFIIGLFALAKGDLLEKLKFAVIVLLPCMTCGVPSTLLFAVPALLYCAMAYSNDWASPDSTSTIGRIMQRLAESVWFRRLIWIPLAFLWWAFITWELSISPWWTLLGVVAGFVVAGIYNSRNRAFRQRRSARFRAFVAHDTPRFRG